MKQSILTLLIMLLPLHALSGSLPELKRVEQLLWENRVILVWPDEPMDVVHIMEQSAYDIDDRHIVWFIIHDQKVVSNYSGVIANTFVAHTNNKYFKLNKKVALIGKDGGVKYVGTELILDTLFNRIDSMPMRMNEMKPKGL